MGLSPQRSPEFTHPAAKGIPPITLIDEYQHTESVPVTQFDTDYRPMTSNSKSVKSKKSEQSKRSNKDSGSKSNSKRLNKTTTNASTSSKVKNSTSMHQELSGRTEEDMVVSSDDDQDEVEIAQKWLDHRKKKLEMLSREFQNTRKGENQFDSAKYTTKETLETLDTEHHPEKYEHEYIPVPQPKKSFSKKQPEIISTSQKTSQRPTPQLGQESRLSENNPFYQNALYSTLKTKSGESDGTYTRNSHTTSKSSLSGIDINKMTREEMIELKKILEERIHLESLDDKIKVIHMSAHNKLQRIEELLASSASDTHQIPQLPVKHQPAPRKNSGSSNQGGKTDKGLQVIDYSLINDFDSIRGGLTSSELSTPHGAHNKHIVITREPVPTPQSAKQEEKVDELDALYQQKLQEFIRIRDRVMKNKMSRGQQAQLSPEDLFKKKTDVAKSSDLRYAAFKNYDLTPNDDTIPEEELSENELVLSVTQSRIGHDLTDIKSQPSVSKTPVNNNFISEKKEEPKKKVQIIEKDARPPRQFYDAGLLDLVQDIEKKDGDKKEKKKDYVLPERNSALKIDDESRIRSSLEEEFNSLFNSVRTMKTSSIEETERLNEQLLKNYENNNLMHTSYSSEEMNSEKDDKEVNDVSASMSRQISSRRNESSLVETDSSVLMITKKIKEMKAQSKKKKF